MKKRIAPLYNPNEYRDEIWRDIQGFEGLYKISNYGRVLSLHYHRGNTQRVLIPRTPTRKRREKVKDVYPYVILSKDSKTKVIKIHRCVASHFIPNPDGKPYVNHIDGDVTNNHATNLEWVTPQENCLHAIHVLNTAPGKGFKFNKSANSRPVAQIYIDKDTKYEYILALYANAYAAQYVTGIHVSSIRACCKGDYLLAGGYKWRYQSSFKD